MAGAVGFAAINKQSWFAAKWPIGFDDLNIAVKELIPIVLASYIWGGSWSRKCIVFKCDNQGVVTLSHNGSCRLFYIALPSMLFIYPVNIL